VNVASWVLRLVVIAIFGQVVFFKLTGAQESRQLFEALGAEPWGRIGSGLAELTAVVLLLIPGRAAYGALFAMALMIGALGAHAFRLGIDFQGDGGALFGMALVAFAASALMLWLLRSEILPTYVGSPSKPAVGPEKRTRG
jgi:uncharacterized membrane protein YphA (DoxX/SURF4 family)